MWNIFPKSVLFQKMFILILQCEKRFFLLEYDMISH